MSDRNVRASAQTANSIAARLRLLQQQAGTRTITPFALSEQQGGTRTTTPLAPSEAPQAQSRRAPNPNTPPAEDPLPPSPTGRRWREAPDEGPASYTAATSATTNPIRTPPLTTQLRSLLNLRTRRTPTAYPANQQPLRPPIGKEISSGLQLVESTIRTPNLSAVLTLPDTTEQVRCSQLVCFDTETTGLAGGVGTKAFMIGAAQWRDGHLHIRQLYLTALGGEAAMLRTFASWLAEDSIFVSYNGKSYDAPLLKGRYRIHRQQHPFESRRHVDLLHPVRRAYRGVWSDCRLQTIERNLLGIVREDDLPGAQAPAAWLAFLRGIGSANLMRVAEHNRQDVATLALLLERIARNESGAVSHDGSVKTQ